MREAMIEESAVEKNGRYTITLGDALFGGVLLIGILMRFVGLGEQPLTPVEAETAWTAWSFWQPDSLMLADGSPLYFSLTRLLTPILGFSDAMMRLVPALFGLGIVLLPWLWRNRLGTMGALAMGLLFAVSPIQTVVSRTAGGDSTAVFTSLLLVIALFQFQASNQRGWLYTAVVAFVLGLNSSPLFYSSLLTLLVAFGIQNLIGSPIFVEKEGETSIIGDTTVQRTALFIGVGVFVAVSTLFLWNPAGIGTAVRLPATWLTQFNLANFNDVAAPFLVLFRYQPELVIIGFLGMGWATWRNHALGSFCIYWFASLVILALVQPGQHSLALLMTLPTAVLGALFANEQIAGRWDSHNTLVAAGTFLVLMLIWVNLARFIRTITINPEELLNLWVILFAVALTAAALYLLTSSEVDFVIQGALLALILFFAYYNWGTAWWLGHDGFNDTRERWVTSGTDDDVRVLVPVIDEISRQLSNSQTDLNILSRVDTPVLRWYLRDYDELEIADTIPATASNAVIITPIDTELALSNDYFGSDYGLLRHQPELINNEAMIIDTLRWWLFQESPTPIAEERVILWIRSDLTRE